MIKLGNIKKNCFTKIDFHYLFCRDSACPHCK